MAQPTKPQRLAANDPRQQVNRNLSPNQQQSIEQCIVEKQPSNIMEWSNPHVCAFMTEVLGGRHQDVISTILKHQVSGVDLVEMNEQNLVELGVPTMHERKQVLRAIKQHRNDPQSTYGKFKVRMFNPSSQKYQEITLKVSDNETKVKHILKQAFQVFTKAKCELSNYCLVKLSHNSNSRSILSNETIFLSILHETLGVQDVFEISSGTEFVTHTSVIRNPGGTLSTAYSDNSSLGPQQVKKEEQKCALERILVDSPIQDDVQTTIVDTLNDEVQRGGEPHDRSKLLIPSFIENKGAAPCDITEFKTIAPKRSQSRTSQGGDGAALKLKTRIGSANMQNALKEKLGVKRQQRNQNATQLTSHESADQHNQATTASTFNGKESLRGGGANKVPQQQQQVQQQQYITVNNQPQKKRQNSQSSYERILGASYNQTVSNKTIDTKIDKGRIAQVNTSRQGTVVIQAQSALGSESKTRKKQSYIAKTPNGSMQNSSGGGGASGSDRMKVNGKSTMKQGINMFQTLNEVPHKQIGHQRNSSKSSCYIAASDLTTERNKASMSIQPRVQNSRSGVRHNNQQQQQPRSTLIHTDDDDQSNMLQCSLEVQNTIQTVVESAQIQNQDRAVVGDLNQILSEFLNEQKINVHVQQANHKERDHSQSRQQHQMLLEQDSLESQPLDEDLIASNNQQCFDLVESQQAYFNEQDQLYQMQMNEQVNQGSQLQQQLRQKAIKHIQTKSMHAFAMLNNQKKQAQNIVGRVQPNNTTHIRRQNYVNSHQQNFQIFSGNNQGGNEGRPNPLYGTFDHSHVSKTQSDGGTRIERGSSVGDQFYTIDNTMKENSMSGINRPIEFGSVHQRPQASRRQEHYGVEQILVQNSKGLLNVGQNSQIKLKNIGAKRGAFDSGSTGGLQRANTLGDRLRSNSNNARQLVNNRYGESCEQLDSNQSHDDMNCF